MEEPKAGGPFVALAELEETLLPLFKDEVAATYLPWAKANMEAAEAKAERVSTKLDGKAYEQVTQHYAARAFKSVTKAIDGAKSADGFAEFLEKAGASDVFA